jgi:two-component system OmpR family response regulator
LNQATHQLLSPGGEEIQLSPVEYDLLFVFLQHPNRVLSREFLLDQTRGRTAMPYDRSIDVHISHLRKKLEANPQSPKLIKTIRNAGYMFTPAVIDLGLTL